MSVLSDYLSTDGQGFRVAEPGWAFLEQVNTTVWKLCKARGFSPVRIWSRERAADVQAIRAELVAAHPELDEADQVLLAAVLYCAAQPRPNEAGNRAARRAARGRGRHPQFKKREEW